MGPARRPSPLWLAVGCALLPARVLAVPVADTLHLELLVQPRLAVDESDDGVSAPLGIDPHLGRLGLALWGQPTEQLSFFAQLGVEDFGRDGDWSQGFGLRDAWVEWAPGPRLQLDAGLMQPPWAVHAMLRDGTQLGISDHSASLPYPTGIAGRDVGVMLRGRILGQRLEYRLAGLAGIETAQDHAATDYDGDGSPDAPPLNPDDIPRVTARLAWSFFEPQGGPGPAGFFQQGLALEPGSDGPHSSRKVLTAGLAIDHQQDALYVEQRDFTGSIASATRADYTALSADLLADLPLRDGDRSLNVLLAGVHTMFDEDHPAAGNGVLAVAGYRVGRWQPLGSYELFDAHASSAHDRVSARLGTALWLDAHHTNLKIEAGACRQGGGNDLLFEGRLQAQLWF